MGMNHAYLALDGFGTLEGRCRSPGGAFGEAVFTTAYTGYEESITDPSYTGQILIFSYPLIGNYGHDPRRFESIGPEVEAVVARELTDDVADWLSMMGIPAIDHVDTRALVAHLREQGHAEAAITNTNHVSPHVPDSDNGKTPAERFIEATPAFADRKGYILNETARDKSVIISGGGRETSEAVKVGFIDCGAKRGIVREFLDRGANLIRYPHTVTPEDIAYDDPDLIFISNGPGNPEWFEQAQHVVQHYAGEKPIAGICLGQQVVALALGGSTEKMKYGHHGINQPVLNEDTQQVKMTTQNHSYSVSDPGSLEVVERNVNDDSAEGLRSEELDIITRQYHPEARPGPRDSLGFFDRVLALGDS